MLGIDPPSTSNPITAVNSLSEQFTVQFWGVRGSIPTPGSDTVRYGGNTACVEMRVGGYRLIFDGGTGLRALGKSLLNEMPVEAHLFFTHTHWDRIQGFPFFIPAFLQNNTFHIYGAIGPNGASIKQRLSDQMLRPNFPVPLQMMRSDMVFNNIAPGSIIELGDVVVETMSLNRPNSALGYRVTWNGMSVVYATDTEHFEGVEQSLLYLSSQSDLLIFDALYADHAYYDCQAIERAYEPKTWLPRIEMAIAANVKQIIVFHHDPEQSDDSLDRLECSIQERFPMVQLAREGMVMHVVQNAELREGSADD